MAAGSNKSVHIRISDTGWVLEALAREIAQRLPYVTYDIYPRADADIQYYMTYGCRQQRVSPIEVALFTHKEAVPSAAAKFDQVAAEVDYCIAQSPATERILRGVSSQPIQTISPGVDLARFEPKLRIGVVGRTYHTGRKGEALMREVIDTPGIEWHFTGPGWPGPSRFVADEDMPAFYRSLDYVLVPALIEGGPMCVLEALASGCKVIGAPVGWVPEFPHIGFKLGDAADLRRVLTELVDEKQALRRSVSAYTWDAWAARHHELFTRLLGVDPMTQAAADSGAESTQTQQEVGALRVAVAVHGLESTTLGGPTVRAPRTAVALQRLGVAAQFKSNAGFEPSDFDVVHVLNVWHPDQCESLLRQVEKHDRPSVLSPIFLDLTERRFFDAKLPEIFLRATGGAALEPALAQFREELLAAKQLAGDAREHAAGYFGTVRRLATYPDHLILLSRHEQELLRQIGVEHPSTSIVKNPVESAVFADADPKLFKQTYGVSDYVLCVGRIESRKNQAMLAYALRDTGLQLVFIGHESDSAYATAVRRWAAPNTVFVGRVEPASAMLASAFAGARVFCLPSWSEGAPLVALEAAAAGCNMVLSNRSSEQEYFGDLARYADPADPADLRSKIMAAFDEGRPVERAEQLKRLMLEEHSWEAYARATAQAYQCAQKRRAANRLKLRQVAQSARRIYIDLTTLAHHDGPPTGIARVEDRLAYEIAKYSHVDVRYVIWNSPHRRFIEVDGNEVHSGQLKELRGDIGAGVFSNPAEMTPYAEIDFRPGDTLLNFGSAWMRNAKYLADLATVKRATGVTLLFAIYDVIQHNLQMTMYSSGSGAEFSRSCKRLIGIADGLLTCSQRSAADIRALCEESNIPLPPITVIRLGDEADSVDPNALLQESLLKRLGNGTPFVLYVSTFDARKNHQMLLEVWRSLIAKHSTAMPILVLVGRLGWRGDEALAYLASDRVLQTRVLHLEGINDPTLEWLYQNCQYTVYPSLYEGWGLPVAESLRHGKLCIASDGGSLAEVAPGFAEYLHPRDFMGWQRAIERYCFSPALLAARTAHAATYQPAKWSRTAEVVIEASDAHRSVDRLPSISLDEAFELREDSSRPHHALSEYLLGGWSHPEQDGTWTVGTKAGIGFQLTEAPPEWLAIKVTASGYAPQGPIDVVVTANDTKVASWKLDSDVAERVARVPASVFGPSRLLRLNFHIANPRSPAEAGSPDSRLLGMCFRSLVLERLVELPLDQWNDISSGAPGDSWSVHSPDAFGNSCYLAFDVVPLATSRLELKVNGRVHSTLVVRHGVVGPVVRRIALSDIAEPGEDVAALSIGVVQGTAPVVKRLGLFSRPPQAALKLAMAPLDHRGAGLSANTTHAPFAGLPAPLAFGATLRIGSTAIRHSTAGGWHAPGNDGTWTNGKPASVYAKVEMPAPHRLRVAVEYESYLPLREAGASFYIAIGKAPIALLNDEETGVSTGQSPRRYEIVLDCADVTDDDGVLAVTLWSTGSLSPADIGDSADARPLSLFVRSIELNAVEQRTGVEEPSIAAQGEAGLSGSGETMEMQAAPNCS